MFLSDLPNLEDPKMTQNKIILYKLRKHTPPQKNIKPKFQTLKWENLTSPFRLGNHPLFLFATQQADIVNSIQREK